MRFCLLLCLAVVFSACSSRYYMKKGTAIYETGRYSKAAGKFERAFDKTKSRDEQAEIAIRIGDVYQQVNRLKDAINWYRKAQKSNKNQPDVYLRLASANAENGDFEAAEVLAHKHEELFGDGRGEMELRLIEQIKKEQDNPGRYFIELKSAFNTRNSSDFAPVYLPGDTCLVYFASTRNPNPNKKRQPTDPITGDGYSHIYIAEYTQEIKTLDRMGNVKIKHFKEPRWLKPALIKDSLYSLKHEGAMCFSKDGAMLYFTSSREVKGRNAGTRIYKASRGEKGWTSLTGSGILGDTVSVGHPAVSVDGNRIYFVTDQIAGGHGGKDIWYVERQGGKWTEPINAGDVINTEKDELFPYVRDNGELFFASDGHGGLGGLDLYKVKEENGKQTLVHLPYPLNSCADDFGIAYKPGLDEGLLTSSRSNKGDNIYSFQFIPQQLVVRCLAQNNITELPVPKVGINVLCDDGTTNYIETDSNGIAAMVVESQREYLFSTDNPRFLKGTGTVSTYRERGDRLYQLTIELQPIERPIVIPNIYFDVAKWELRPDAKENLNELIRILKDNPNITVELSAHTDMVGRDEANMILSENRAKSVVEYLISQGIYWDRLEAKGYGKTMPRQINEREAREYDFLKAGDVLNERFIKRLKGEDRLEAMQLNRRIEFKVLRTNYKPTAASKQRPANHSSGVTGEKESPAVQTVFKELKTVKGKFYTLELGVFKSVPNVVKSLKVVFTEEVKGKGVRYCTGIYDAQEEATAAAGVLKEKGIDATVKEYKH